MGQMVPVWLLLANAFFAVLVGFVLGCFVMSRWIAPRVLARMIIESPDADSALSTLREFIGLTRSV